MVDAVLAIGPPGVGKSTALKGALEDLPGRFHYLSTGDLFREFMRDYPDHPFTIYTIEPMFRGGALASDLDTLALVNEYLPRVPAGQMLLYDGLIRKLSQMHFERELQTPLRGVLCFDDQHIPAEEWERRRVKRGRKEETPEVWACRQEVYRETTLPLIEAYRAQGILHVIDAYPVPVRQGHEEQDEKEGISLVRAATVKALTDLLNGALS